MTPLDRCCRATSGTVLLGGIALATLFASASELRAAVAPLIAHEAVYDLKLAQSHKMSLESVRGRIVYEFTGSACAGYTTQVRQVTEMDNGEGALSVNDLRSKTWEDSKATRFKFTSTNLVNEKPAVAVAGEAKRDAKGIQVTLKQPVEKTFRLDPATVFPTEQLTQVIAAARAGKKFVELPVFDGSDNGEKVYNTLAVIGDVIPPSVKATDAAEGKTALANVPRWHVRVSYFDKTSDASANTGEQTPAYEIAFEVYENGISRALTLDYPEFAIAGTMSTLELKRPEACK